VINKFLKKNKKLRKSSGTALIEYVLIATMIVLVIVGALKTIGGKYVSIYNSIDSNLNNALQ
jgi:Flp pilus assembly pilin Flp